jgi:hypothetical protein
MKDAAGNRSARQYSLAEGLQILNEHNYFTIFREQRSGKWFIRENTALHQQGMFIHLHGYESHVYLDFYQVQDTDGLYRKLYETLDGRGIYDIELRKKELFLEPIHLAFKRFLQSPLITPIRQALYKGTGLKKIFFDDYWSYYDDFLDECLRLGYGSSGHKAAAITHFQKNLEAIGTLSTSSNPVVRPHTPNREGYYHRGLTIMPETPLLMLAWTLLTPLQEFIQEDSNYSTAAECAADLLLPQQFAKSFREQGVEEESLSHLYKLIIVTVSQQNWLTLLGDGGASADNRSPASELVLEQIIREPFTAVFLDLHHDNNQEWYKGESMQELLWWLNTIALLAQIQSEEVFAYIKGWLQAEESAEYRIELLLESSVT